MDAAHCQKDKIHATLNNYNNTIARASHIDNQTTCTHNHKYVRDVGKIMYI